MAENLVNRRHEVPLHPEPLNVFVVERPYLIHDGRNPSQDIMLRTEGEKNEVELLTVDMNSELGQKKKFEVTKAFPSSANVETVFNTSVHRLVDSFVLGYNASVLCVGASEHGKTQLFGGTSGSPSDPSATTGIVGLGMDDLWDLLDSATTQFKLDKRQYQYKVEISCFELYDEKVHDLLVDGGIELQVINDPEVGFCVAGLTKQQVSSAAAATDLFSRSKLLRQSSMGDYDTVPPSHDSTYFFQVVLQQQFERPAEGVGFGGGAGMVREHLKSCFYFCEVAGTEVLVKQRQRKKTLAQGVRSLKAVADQVGSGLVPDTNDHGGQQASSTAMVTAGQHRRGSNASGSGNISQHPAHAKHWESDFANFPQSLLTKLLQQALGGNCQTVCIASLMQGGAECNSGTMKLVDSLRKVECHPVPFSPRLAMLLRRMRINIIRLQEQLEAFRLLGDAVVSEDGKKDSNVTEMQLAKLQEKTLELQIKLKEMRQSRDKVQQELERLRVHYEKLVEKKSDMQADFISTEEEKLRVSKALLDLQIENNQLRERLDQGQYDVDSKTLTLEHDLIEMQVERDALTEKQQQMETDLKEAAEELRDLQEEYITLRTNYINLTKEFNDAKQKNENINAEFLTLVNKSNLLEEQNKELTVAKQDLLRETEASKRTANVLEIENSKAVEEARELRANVIQLEAEKMNLEARLKSQEVEFDEQRLQLEQTAADKSLAQEGELLTRQRGLQNEQNRFNTEISMLQQSLDQTQAQLRASERKRRAAVQASEDAAKSCDEWRARYRESEAMLADKTAAYQRQLVTYVIGNDTESQWFKEVGQHLFKQSDGTSEALTKDSVPPVPVVNPQDNDEASIPGRAVHEMVLVHDETIRQMTEKVKKAEREADHAKRNAAALRRAYTELHEQVQDLAPTANIQCPPLEETLRATAADKDAADKELAELAKDREDRIHKLTRQLEQECETRVKEAAGFVRDRSALQEKIRLLEAKLEGTEKAADDKKPPEDVSPQVKQLLSLQQELLKKLDEIQKGNPKEGPPEAEKVGADGSAPAPDAEGETKTAATGDDGADLDPDAAGKKKHRKKKAGGRKKRRKKKGEGSAAGDKKKDAKIAKLEKQLAAERKKNKQKGRGGHGSDGEIASHDEWKSKAEGLQAKLEALQKEYDALLDRLESGLVEKGKGDLSKSIRSAESRAAHGMTKYTMAEAELKNYKEFMNKTIKNYNKKIADLKKRLK